MEAAASVEGSESRAGAVFFILNVNQNCSPGRGDISGAMKAEG